MNTPEQAIALATKATNILKKNQGVFNLKLFDGKSLEVKILNINSHIDENGFRCTLTTFTKDKNKTTDYDIYNIQDIA